jgi:hypothetical protein
MTNPNRAIEREWVNIGPDPQDTVAAEFVSHLKGLGHTDLTLTGYRDGARHFCEWLRVRASRSMPLMMTSSSDLRDTAASGVEGAGTIVHPSSMCAACSGSFVS